MGLTVITSKSVPHSGQDTTSPSSTSSSSKSRSLSHSGQYTIIASDLCRLRLLIFRFYAVTGQGVQPSNMKKSKIPNFSYSCMFAGFAPSRSPMPSLLCGLAAVVGLFLCASGAHSSAGDAHPGAVTMPADPQIAAALKEVSPDRIQATIDKLVGFHTRLTLSDQSSQSIAAGRGIGAAREWIKSEFEQYSKECGGCLQVKTDTFTQPPADRIPKATEITNVYAVL